MSENSPDAVGGRPEKPWLFKPGQSGNPGGRTRSADIAVLARKHAPAAIAALAAALEDPKTRVPAAVALLNRGYGMPVQAVAAEDGGSVTLLHLVAARALGPELQAVLDAGKPLPPVIDAEAAEQPTTDGSEIPVDLTAPALE